MNEQQTTYDQDLMQKLEEGQELELSTSDVDGKYLTFLVDGQLYGIPIADVTAIQQVEPTTPMPELPQYVKGIINLRGSVVPIVDLSLRFGRNAKPHTDRTCFIIVSLDNMDVGFVVEQVNEVLSVDDRKISPPPMFSTSDSGGRYVVGVAPTEKGMLLLLDSRRILGGKPGAFGL